MESIRQSWNKALEDARAKSPDAEVDSEVQATLRARAIHALKFFTFHPSTPSPVVSTALEEAFFASGVITSMFSSSKSPFPFMSTTGVRDAADVRYPDDTFSGFIKNLPVIPKDMLEQAKDIIDTLHRRGFLKDITFMDVLQELRDRPLSEPEMVACFKWWIKMYTQGSSTNLDYVRTQLLNAAVLSIEEKDKPSKIIPLSIIESFLNSRSIGSHILTDGPLPPHLLPVTISRNFDPASLVAAFGWRELSVVEWLRHLANPPAPHDAEHDLHLSPQWAERVLTALSRASQSLSKNRLDEVAGILREHECIPTSRGLKKPEEAYFQSAHVFSDLPVISLPSGAVVKGPLEKFLQTIGVRKHVELQIVFDRYAFRSLAVLSRNIADRIYRSMIKTGDWTIADLIKYLVDVQSTLTVTEMDRLRMTAAFPRERRDGEKLPENGKPPRHRASDLYEPLDVFRDLKLPVIDWGNQRKWRGGSEEGTFEVHL